MKINNIIFDACALIAFLNNEAGTDIVESILIDGKNKCFVHAVNLCEVFYEFLRAGDEALAQSVIDDILLTGLTVREDMDMEFWKQIGRYKVRGRISLADCFCISLAIRLDGEIITSDRHEFEEISNKKLAKVKFIR